MTEHKEDKAVDTWPCPKDPPPPFTLWELVEQLEKDAGFAGFFFDLLKRANNNEKGAIECVDSYFAPSDDDLQRLNIPVSQWSSLRKCTESGLLVAVIAQEKAGLKKK